jgi:hypothetical protein
MLMSHGQWIPHSIAQTKRLGIPAEGQQHLDANSPRLL